MRIDSIPMTNNGKINKAALPSVTAETAVEYEEPQTDVERAICKAFEMILGTPQVGRKNNFFELGGDSIKAIRIISKLRSMGYTAVVKDIMTHKTAEKIAAYVTQETKSLQYEQGEVNGKVEKTPIIKKFDKWNFKRPGYFNQAVMLTVTGFSSEAIKKAVEKLVKHHDILRGVYRQKELIILPVSESKLFDYYEFDYSSMDNIKESVQKKCEEIQASIDIENGPLVKSAVFETGTSKVMMLCIHHLLVDSVSWHILTEDFNSALAQAASGNKIVLPDKTVSFIEWSRNIKEYGETMSVKERNFWKDISEQTPKGIIQIPDIIEEDTLSGKMESIVFDKETTEYLLKKSVNVSGARIDELMLSSLARSVKDLTGQRYTSIRLEGHGREKISDIMTDRTVGWFTNMYSIVLENFDDVYENIIHTKEVMRKASQWKIGGSFAELDGAEPDISFNYLGEYSGDENFAEEYSAGQSTATENVSNKGIIANGQIYNGQLYFDITGIGDKFSSEFVRKFTERFKANLEAAAKYCSENVVEEKTASDYGIYDLTVEEFRRLQELSGNKIAKIYSLTPLQEGMLFYNIENEASTSYVLQHVFNMSIELDTDILRTSLMLLSERYEVLKTAIVYNYIPEPKQIVYTERMPELNVIELNSSDEFSEYIEKDVDRGFRLDEDTLLRVTVLRSVDKCSLLWTIHHIITDGWCSELLFNALMKYYSMLSEGTAAEEIRTEIKAEKAEQGEYSDYIDWIEKQNTEKAKLYWKKLLEGYENNTEITPMEKPPRSRKQMERIRRTVSVDVTNKLVSIAEEYQSTINTVSEAACGILMQRYTGSNDVVFGKVVSGRNAAIKNIESIVGLFINTIPVRVISEPQTTVTELIKSQQTQSMNGTEYDFCSLAEIQRMTSQGSDLIKVLYVFENYTSGTESQREQTPEDNDNNENRAFDIETVREQTNYSFSISGYISDGELGFDVKYNPNEFCQNEVELFLERLCNICTAMAENPNGLVSSISELTNEEREKVLTVFNDTKAEYPSEKTLVELFEQQAEKTPNDTAVIYRNSSLTYAELNSKANALAYRLRELGIQPNDFAAIIADRSLELVCGVYGILKSGGAYVPIDPTYPQDRISFMIEDCSPKAVLVFTEENIALPENVTIIDLHDVMGDNGISENPQRVNKSNDLAYCIYTSGTTGRPKGVVLEHSSVINHLTVTREKFYRNGVKGDTPLFTSFAFDFTVPALFGTLPYGDRLAVMENIGDLVAYSENNTISVFKITPSYFNSIYDAFKNHEGQVKTVVFGGETLTSETVKNARSVFGESVVIFNEYGPTEATVFTTAAELAGDMPVTIGKPVSNSQIYIVNENRLCGIGIAGELCIAGAGLARGYLNRPELTAEKFTDIPFAEGRMYRSGDMARWLPDGNIEYLGRIDDQIKIRGFRVELGEIANRIRELDIIKDCAVLAKTSPAGDKAIYAYYTSDEEIKAADLRDRLSVLLPHYMIPSYMMQIEQIPVTQNGKLDRNALPEILIKSEKEFIPPETKLEKEVCEVLGSVLGVDKVSLNDNFFELGGDSLKAIRIVAKLRELGYNVSVYNVMQYSQIKQFIDEAVNDIEQSRNVDEYGLAERTAYTKYAETYLEKSVNAILIDTASVEYQKVEQSLKALAEHHDILRALWKEDTILIDSTESGGLPKIELIDCALDNVSVERKCKELRESVDIKNGSAIQAAVFANGGRMKVMIAADSLIIDTKSLRILAEDLLKLLNSSSSDEGSILSDKTNSFISWSRELNAYQKTSLFASNSRYWRKLIPTIREYRMSELSESGERQEARFTIDLGTEEAAEKINSAFNTDYRDLIASALAEAAEAFTGNVKNTVIYSDDVRGVTETDSDYARTVGRMSVPYPILLEKCAELDNTVIVNKESLNSVPNGGMEYGMTEGCQISEKDYIRLTYLGNLQTSKCDGVTDFTLDMYEDSGSPIAICSYICNNRLEVTVRSYSGAAAFAGLYQRALESVFEYCGNKDEKVMTATDFDSTLDMDDFGGILDILSGRDF